jgi:hypothetical protein
MNSATPNQVQKFIALAKADPKRTGVLGVLVLVLVGIWLYRMASGNGGPVKVIAAATPSAAPKVGGRVTSDTSGSDEAAVALSEWLETPIAPLGRNLFAIKLDYYPQDGSAPKHALRPPIGNGFWDELAKSMTSQADQKRERQILVENIRLQAAQLRLETILMGAKPRALINGQLIGEGGVVASFRVLKIEPRRIIVEREGIKLEILMK